jgi:hypothetical protein
LNPSGGQSIDVPLQLSASSQRAFGAAARHTMPVFPAAQVPVVHDAQTPVQAMLQQIPATQLPWLQSVPTLQAWPSPDLSPQWCVCVLHRTVEMQSASLPQEVAHPLPLQVL